MQPDKQDALIFYYISTVKKKKKVPVTKGSLTYSIFKMKKKYS